MSGSRADHWRAADGYCQIDVGAQVDNRQGKKTLETVGYWAGVGFAAAGLTGGGITFYNTLADKTSVNPAVAGIGFSSVLVSAVAFTVSNWAKEQVELSFEAQEGIEMVRDQHATYSATLKPNEPPTEDEVTILRTMMSSCKKIGEARERGEINGVKQLADLLKGEIEKSQIEKAEDKAKKEAGEQSRVRIVEIQRKVNGALKDIRRRLISTDAADTKLKIIEDSFDIIQNDVQ